MSHWNTDTVLGLARNTYVKIRFKRDGRVKDADFVDGISLVNVLNMVEVVDWEASRWEPNS